MKVKELIAELEQKNPESELYVSVYDCGGFNDIYGIDNVDQFDPEEAVQIAISTGCDTHRKWTGQQNCPLEKLEKAIKSCDDLKKTIDFYKEQMTFLEKRFQERLTLVDRLAEMRKKEGK